MREKQITLLIFVLLALLSYPRQIHAQKSGTIELFSKKTGQRCIFHVEIAESEAERSRGLMFREAMDPQAGMLFIYQDQKIRTFWMKNTRIPLDMIFISKELRIVYIHHKAVPMDETSILSRFPARYVLEVNAGLAKQYGFARGDKVKIK